MRGGRVRRKIRQQPFPYPVFGRFAYRVSAPDGHCLFVGFGDFLVFEVNVHPYQTPCTRTAGH